MIDHLRGTGVVATADAPLRTVTTSGSHQALAEAFMLTLGQTGGATKFQHNVSSVDDPLRTIVTKAHSSCIEIELEVLSEEFLHNCETRGVDTERAETFLKYVCEELHKNGHVDAKPWIYVYYSSGAEGSLIDSPLPTVRTKAGHALVYPVIELHGKLLKIDLLYRMLTPLELQRAMGFPDDMSRGGCNQTDFVRGIGNSVSRGVARALGLAWYAQDSDVWKHVKHLYQND